LEGILDIFEEPVPLVLVEAGLLQAGEAGLQGHLRLLVSATIQQLTFNFLRNIKTKLDTACIRIGTVLSQV
jgi:hypothetical protein